MQTEINDAVYNISSPIDIAQNAMSAEILHEWDLLMLDVHEVTEAINKITPPVISN